MAREVKQIYLLVDKEDFIDGLLMRYEEYGMTRFYAEHTRNCTTEEKENFSNLLAILLFNYSEKVKLVYPKDKKYRMFWKKIAKYDDTDKWDTITLANILATTFSGLALLIGKSDLDLGIAAGAQLVGALGSLSSIRSLNKSIALLSNKAKKKSLRRLYVTTLALNLLFTSVTGYRELTKPQLERDVEAFLQNKDKSIENPFDLEINYTDDAKIDLLMTAIQENKNLKDEDKDILYGLRKLLHDDPYVDYRKLYEKFASLGIIYTEEENKHSGATYYHYDNYIIDYNSNSIAERDYHKEEISELLIKCLIGSLNEYECLNNGIKELLISTYITGDQTKTFSKTVASFMLKTVGKETLLEAYSTSNFEIIEKRLKEINDNEDDYNRLIYILKDPEPYRWRNFYYDNWIDIRDRYDCYRNPETESKASGFQKKLKPKKDKLV